MNYIAILSIVLFSTTLFAQNPISITAETNANAMTTTIDIPFEQSSTNWTAERLVYGPIELLTGPLTPLGGLLAGGTIGALIPIQAFESPRYYAAPYTALAGAVTGATLGAMIAPVVIIEGVFDTLTGGYFSKHPYAWFAFSPKKTPDQDDEGEDGPQTDPAGDITPNSGE